MRHTILMLLALLTLPAIGQAQTPTETIEYYATDAIGSIRVVFGANGVVLGRQDYDPFGRELLPAPILPAERFGGQEKDAETDQGYFHARQYQSRTGRFTRVDPIYAGLFEPQRLNRYAYALNNPATFTDANGLMAEACEGQTTTFDEESKSWKITPCRANGGGGGGGSLWGPWGLFWGAPASAGNSGDGSYGGLVSRVREATPSDVIAVLDTVHDVVNPSKDLHDCQALNVGSCVAVAAAIPPFGAGTAAKLLPKLVAKLPGPFQRSVAFPTKKGAGGHPQFYDGATGRYLEHLAPLWRNPAQFTIGLLEGVMSGASNAPMPASLVRSRTFGQTLGQAMYSLWPF